MTALNSLLRRKLTRRFELLDVDGDGFAGESGYLGTVAAIHGATGTAAASAQGQALREALLGWWRRLRSAADTDGDGRVGLREYEAALESRVVQRQNVCPEHGRPKIEAVVAVADRDGDGRLTEAEFVTVMTACRVGDPDARWQFRRMDTDGDRRISLAGFDHAMEDFHTSADEALVGTTMWGRL
ncbi:EF-hand domain-containing protein [Streptomyces lasiicapitis]|uniref:Calcium-binding protein n=1 Tax=Streptomyces lasiicapitis TaxID=1923961 RepID=A0ABQ2LIL5_9ACTN|nr:EF-hand domain-containing protein [Streptomyces lasiicapitis]GGO35443.1 calcium-binding protein [Streptomyces lasiicapitis]